MEDLGSKPGRKFLCTSHQKTFIAEESARAEVAKIEGLHYIKIAMEKGCDGKEHLQFYTETANTTTGKALSKKLNKINKGFWNSAHCEYCKAPHLAIQYPGNLEFKHANGEAKGGEVFWCFKTGEPYKNNGQADKQRSKWKEKLLEMKAKIDEGNDLFYLWENYFSEMIQCSRAFRDYLRDRELKKETSITQESYRIEGDILTLRQEILDLQKTNETLCQQIWTIRERQNGAQEDEDEGKVF
jgi:hypothetical protein